MLFHTFEFVVFFSGLLALLTVFRGSETRKLLLLIASYVFYMWWNVAFVLLIVASTMIDYTVGGQMEDETDPRRRKRLLLISLVANLGLLGTFKYADFAIGSVGTVLGWAGVQTAFDPLGLLLPVGISFYTFQTLSYTLDLYRGNIPAARSPLDFALFVAFFPQLVAGPIVRAADFLPQLREPVALAYHREHVFLALRGLAKKVLIADNVGVFVDAIFADPDKWPSIVIWIATLAFAIQIYCDFSGYSDIAIAIAGFLGFKLPKNFDHPYLARNPSDFWRRWHISLSSWLRDYLYISLGGNRGGQSKTARNLMLTMLLGGLWHGASWNFVTWGALHGSILVAHRYGIGFVKRFLPDDPSPFMARFGHLASILAFQYWVMVTWITFRIVDFTDMSVAIRKFVLFDMNFSIASLGLGALPFFSTLALMGGFGILHLASARVDGIEHALARAPRPVGALACLFLGFALFCLWPTSDAPFIYFQF